MSSSHYHKGWMRLRGFAAANEDDSEMDPRSAERLQEAGGGLSALHPVNSPEGFPNGRPFGRRSIAGHAGASCELCSAELDDPHRHLLECSTRKVVCACDGCALTFHDVVGGRFKLVPRDARRLDGFKISDEAWFRLSLPIDLAFIIHDSEIGRIVAMYPSPAGVTSSEIQREDWAGIAELLGGVPIEPDVEALLVNRARGAREYFIAPIDLCYELAGIIRLYWRGFSGGDRVQEEIRAFFQRLRRRARPNARDVNTRGRDPESLRTRNA